jgi:hypothetical protein
MNPTMTKLLEKWEPMNRLVAAVKREMEAGHYYTPLREEYERVSFTGGV